MKPILNILGIGAAGIFGYMFEPNLRFQLTGIQPASEATHEKVAIEEPAAPTTPSPTTPQIDVSGLASSQLPERVLLNAEAKVADSKSGIVMTIEAGNRVKPVRIEGESIIISPGDGPFVGKVAISDTDLLQQLAANPPGPATPAPEPTAAVAPTPEPAPTPTGESEEPAAMADPTPAPESTPAPETAATGGDVVVAAMQDSVKTAQIKEFTFQQVLKWEAGPVETIDGESYQTGLASYKAETIFGVKTIQAKALLKDGKVQRWIWPKSGMEIK
ncbi:MAG: hypothetical protein ABI162_17340 [Luteolibacter sp.]